MDDEIIHPEVGDFVNMKDEYGDVWHEVLEVWEGIGSPAFSMSCRDTRYDDNRIRGVYTFKDRIRKIHKKDAPWGLNEVRIVSDRDGRFGERETPELPDKYKETT